MRAERKFIVVLELAQGAGTFVFTSIRETRMAAKDSGIRIALEPLLAVMVSSPFRTERGLL
jgi:hypothetical protein